MKLIAKTPAGDFSRTTKSLYAFVNVWNSPRAAEVASRETRSSSGVMARWQKDRGFGVTWHKTRAAAELAAMGRYGWDPVAATFVGTFAVEVL